MLALDDGQFLSSATWIEPNRLGNPPLHIAQKGQRFATITGVSWLDDSTYIALHRNGQRIGVFDLEGSGTPVFVFEVTHQADDIAAQPSGPEAWKVAVSGCWKLSYSTFNLRRTGGGFEMQHDVSHKDASRGFSHGVSFNHLGQVCYAIQAGADPRIVIGTEIHRLPRPWGPRKVIFDHFRRRYLAVAVSTNASRKAYVGGQTTVWSAPEGEGEWRCLISVGGVHSDSIGVSEDHIWLPDQNGDRLLLLDAKTGKLQSVLASENLDFPHGLEVSADGKVAVTNYGSSSVSVFSPFDGQISRAFPEPEVMGVAGRDRLAG